MRNILIGLCLAWLPMLSVAQGPPITLDKPLMLGAGNGTVRVLAKSVALQTLRYQALLLEGDYNFSAKLAAGVELPLALNDRRAGLHLGDAAAFVKYQFVRLDGKGKSFRLAAKAKHMFPTGPAFRAPLVGMGLHMSYAGLVAAYESLHLGVQSELGYLHAYTDAHMRNLSYKFGVGLPLLKPTYPVNQVTVYLETEGLNLRAVGGQRQYGYYYAPGLQYARGKATFDASLQLPIAQQVHASLARQWTGLVGFRYIL
jgi:hypothetical protein